MLADPSVRPARPRGVPGGAVRPGPEPWADALSELRPLQGMTARARRAAPPYTRTGCSSLRGAFPEFLPLRRSRPAESTNLQAPPEDGACADVSDAGYVPPPGFPTLLTACSSAGPPGLFRPGGALGVHSSELSSRLRAVTPLGVRCPPDVGARAPTRTPPASPPRRRPWPETGREPERKHGCHGRSPSGRSLPQASREPRGGYSPRPRVRCSPEFLLSRDCAPAPGPPFRGGAPPGRRAAGAATAPGAVSIASGAAGSIDRCGDCPVSPETGGPS